MLLKIPPAPLYQRRDPALRRVGLTPKPFPILQMVGPPLKSRP